LAARQDGQVATFSYADAVKFLGGKENKIVAKLDKLLGGALLAGSGFDLFGLLGWFDAKVEFIRLSHELVTSVSERRSGISRYTRTQRLHAAHTVIVLVAFFEAFDESDIPLTSKDLDLTKQRQRDLPGITHLHDAAVPLPSPEKPYEDHLKALREWYRDLGSELVTLVEGLALWDDLDDTARERIRDSVWTSVPSRAQLRYQELFRQLATDCPEVGFWWALHDSQATRTEIRSVGTALAQLERTLLSLAVGETPADRQRLALGRKYQAVLDHPVIEPDQDTSAFHAPKLRDCYIDPLFQVCEAGRGTTFASVQWWDSEPIRDDVNRFFTGYLTSPKATEKPMLVLGDPGAGKSMLTKMLAARLPASDFLVLRVELRSAPTEASVLDQIEHSLRESVQEQVSWPALTNSAEQALPVVLLDGFDELLQATGVSQTDYLHKIARFQQESTELGRPVAVVVTSRISVADRAAAPDGSPVLRLVPFVESQIGRWLEAWNKANKQYFEAEDLQPLALERVMRYPELSEQPLLLLMLALYDADTNALQRDSEVISQADLYERLLERFALREVRKDGDHRAEQELAAAVEAELERLSIVAFAMFNRGTQWVTEQDLDADLAALLPGEPAAGGLRKPLGAGETVLGRFFFVQQAEATRDERTLRTYEFLHATFGEYLVARSTWRVLLDLVEVENSRTRRRFAGEVDDSELYALLSFMPLCVRGPVVEFLKDMAGQVERPEVVDLLVRLFHAAGRYRQNRSLDDYEPVRLLMPARYATYSQNLVLLAVLAGGELKGSDLFGPDIEIGTAWRGWALLWQSQLSFAGWTSVVDTLQVDRTWHDRGRDVRVRLSEGNQGVPLIDLNWLTGNRGSDFRLVELGDTFDILNRQAYFSCTDYGDIVNHVIAPIDKYLPNVAWGFSRGQSGQWLSGAGTILDLFFVGSEDDLYRRDLLNFLPRGSSRAEELRLFDGLFFDAVASRFDVFDVSDFEENKGLTEDPRFWEILCDQLGKGGDDDRLLSLLCRSWDIGVALQEIPVPVLDAWLRMTEGGVAIEPPTPSLRAVLDQIDLESVARTRPDLITRVRALELWE
jgi:hypothetical protein